MDINGTNFYLILTQDEWLGNTNGGLSWDSSIQALCLTPYTKIPCRCFNEFGQLVLPVFDGKEPGCVWHRLFLDAYIPPGTNIKVESYATNHINEIPDERVWLTEPSLYCRTGGAELPYYKPFLGEDSLPDGKGTWELLLQRAHGRYMYLRLTITGPGNMTPYLYALRIYYPRFSYLEKYLPAVYRDINHYLPEDIKEAGGETDFSPFLERFLANIEGFYTEWEEKINQTQALLDVDIIGSEYLEWLAGWFGITLDPSWDEARKRLFLRHAMELFNQRGTPSGIIRAIRLVIDPNPDDTLFKENVTACSDCPVQEFSVRIVENFLAGGEHGMTIKAKAHQFIVWVPINPGIDTETQQQLLNKVKRIVQIEKPAHTTFEIKTYRNLH